MTKLMNTKDLIEECVGFEVLPFYIYWSFQLVRAQLNIFLNKI